MTDRASQRARILDELGQLMEEGGRLLTELAELDRRPEDSASKEQKPARPRRRRRAAKPQPANPQDVTRMDRERARQALKRRGERR